MKVLDRLSLVYDSLGDDLSRMLYTYRLGYSLSGRNEMFVSKIIRTNVKINSFYNRVENLVAKKVIYGAGTRGRRLFDVCPRGDFECFIDKNTDAGNYYKGIPVINTDDFLSSYNGEYIIITSSEYKLSMLEVLKKYNVPEDKILNYCDVLDECYNDQYFDLPNICWCDEEVFIDMGCWNGDTDVLLKNKIGARLKKCIVFEASQGRFDICKQKLEENKINYEFIPKGAYSRQGTLVLKMADDGQVSTSVGRKYAVDVTSLDIVLKGEKCTFIKMDIEGAELEALIGSKDTIKQYAPKMAIAVYHKPEDIYTIPLKILEINPNYKFYLRHYQHTSLETVLYAIPID